MAKNKSIDPIKINHYKKTVIFRYILKHYLEEIRSLIVGNQSESRQFLIEKLSCLTRQWWDFLNFCPFSRCFLSRPFLPLSPSCFFVFKKTLSPSLPCYNPTTNPSSPLSQGKVYRVTKDSSFKIQTLKLGWFNILYMSSPGLLFYNFLPLRPPNSRVESKTNSSFKKGQSCFFSFIKAKEKYCDLILLKILWKWAYRRHSKKSNKWLIKQYFSQINGRSRVFTTLIKALPLHLLNKNPGMLYQQTSLLKSKTSFLVGAPLESKKIRNGITFCSTFFSKKKKEERRKLSFQNFDNSKDFFPKNPDANDTKFFICARFYLFLIIPTYRDITITHAKKIRTKYSSKRIFNQASDLLYRSYRKSKARIITRC